MQWPIAISVILVAVFLLLYALHGYYLVRNRVPLVRLPRPVVQPVLRALELTDETVLYDLGCGDGRILQAALAARPDARVIGIENNLVAWAWARLRLGRRARLVWGDILRQDLSGTTRLVAYLGPELMVALEPKLARELPPGARLVAVQFPLPRPASRVIRVPNAPIHAQKLYVYDF